MSKPESIPDEMLSAYLDGELTSEERDKVEAALDSSSELRALLAELKQLRNEIQSLPRFQLDDNFAKRVVVAAQESDKKPVKLSTSSVSKTTGSRPRTYQSQLKMMAGIVAAAAAILVACWAMFPNSPGNPQVSKVDLATQDNGPQASPMSEDTVLETLAESTADRLEVAPAPGGLSGAMDGMGNERQANSFEMQRHRLDVESDFGSSSSADQVAPAGSARFSPLPEEDREAFARSAPGSESNPGAHALERAGAPAAAPATEAAPQMLADSASPIVSVESDEQVRPLPSRNERKQSVDAVMYIAKTAALGLKVNQANLAKSSRTNQLSFSRGGGYAYREVDLTQQRSLSTSSLAAVSNASFEGIDIPSGSELLVLDGTPEQVRAALLEVGATPTSMNLLTPKADDFALMSLAAAKTQQSLKKPGQPSLRIGPTPNKGQSGLGRSADAKSDMQELAASKARESKTIAKPKKNVSSKDESASRVRVLLVVQPK